ncbi:hypothetical protein HPB52_024181 [Rhipicephalus sanguineus]|uniref:Probable 26S proteasome non-ATPase regulatory subunit 3 n=1 Tax=Rhipicephalus sanguineus TaxID=34632 RepID=A0A9D4SVP2_RHISA|nr:hypothetical protein HPB52_024181 [Rhipicephalus sanguineus]
MSQASKLVSKSAFPEAASNNEWARYLYYLGRIRAIQLDYSEARQHLLQAIRKAPQHAALGFKQTDARRKVQVSVCVAGAQRVSSLGEAGDKRPLSNEVRTVRAGNLGRFNEVLEHFGAKFQADHTFTLIIRLRHNVIKTGVRMINLSYLRISLADVAHKLQLDNSEDAEFIVAKAIRDGVIEATIDHERGCMQSKENMDIYCTREPQAAFHQRICFCLDIHNQSVKLEVFVSVGEALKGYLGWNQHAASAQIVEGNVRGWQFVIVSLRGGFVRFEGADEDEGAVGAITVNGESARRKAQHETARNSVDAEGRET